MATTQWVKYQSILAWPRHRTEQRPGTKYSLTPREAGQAPVWVDGIALIPDYLICSFIRTFPLKLEFPLCFHPPSLLTRPVGSSIDQRVHHSAAEVQAARKAGHSMSGGGVCISDTISL
ncbi:hypothetical protein RRG08_038077 [Elysia crispata]|uniref:Uncharacterized protein n=1 Tax=Elysia crispata TaxID=231223 RepID=A0AAE0ZYW1_9GAST|nr:hypothetical protein RRG08_038077 [Elysia crispata]